MKKVLLIPFLLVFATLANGQITFDFHSGSATIGSGLDLDDLSSGTSTVGGVTLTADARLDGVSADTVFNGAGTSWGINAVGGGDETQRFDNDNGIEAMIFNFNTAGTFETIDLRYIEDSAEAVLSFAGGNSFDLFAGSPTETTGGTTEIHTITESFVAGQNITLSVSNTAAAGENFSLESFTITTAAIPEPSTYALMFGALALGLVAWKRRRSSVAQ